MKRWGLFLLRVSTGWLLVLFYPSLIIGAAALLLWGTIDEDRMALDARAAP